MDHGFKWKVIQYRKITYGTSYYQDKGETFRSDLDKDGNVIRKRIQGPFGDDSTYEQLGFFVQDIMSLNDRFDLNIGSRFTHIDANIGRYENPQTGLQDQLNNDWDNLSNSLRGIYKKDDKLNIYAGLSQGFRAPNFSDLIKIGFGKIKRN